MLSLVLELGRYFGEAAGDLEPVKDRTMVETGASDEQRRVPTSIDLLKHSSRLGLKRGN